MVELDEIGQGMCSKKAACLGGFVFDPIHIPI